MAENEQQDVATPFWGSVDAEGVEVMINLRRVRYARPSGAGVRLVFAADDVLEVTADFATVSRRLYAAFDPPAAAGGGKEEGGDESGKGESGGGEHAGG